MSQLRRNLLHDFVAIPRVIGAPRCQTDGNLSDILQGKEFVVFLVVGPVGLGVSAGVVGGVVGVIAVLPSSLRAQFDERIAHLLEKAQLSIPEVKQARSGQRTGAFSEYRGYILAEMQSLARASLLYLRN